MAFPTDETLKQIYGECEASKNRFKSLEAQFTAHFGAGEAYYFTSPGRSEIIGNHTDHNGGKVIAAAVTMDSIGAARANGTDVVRLISQGYQAPYEIALSQLDQAPKAKGTLSLLAGVFSGALHFSCKVSGFDAYVSSNVIPSAGVSSSASFEVLVASMINTLFNGGKMSCLTYAKIGQYAENNFWNKGSGLMDQLACAVGGPIALDFLNTDTPYRSINFTFERFGYDMVIVNTGKGHADLSAEYSAVPSEMKEAAAVVHAEWLADTTLEDILANAAKIKNDRAFLRALHFFTENERVEAAEAAMAEGRIADVLSLLSASGRSSFEWLQNCYCDSTPQDQKISRALALTELFLRGVGDGCCRVHGGGFAGVILCVCPKQETARYIEYISKYVGRASVYPLNIRKAGAVCVH